MELDVGQHFQSRITVEERHTASSLGSGDLEVLATPALIAFLEMTCKDALSPLLPEGSTSVGTHIELDHLKASPVGAVILCHAVVTGIRGRLVDFAVRAEAGGIPVGAGHHTRAIVDRQRFLAGLNK